MMMSLDQFVFSLDTLAFQELQRRTGWKWAINTRVGARDGRQFLGEGDDTFSLSGDLYPDIIGMPESLDELRAMGSTGQAFALVDGTGKVYGAYTIDSVEESQTLFRKDGTPRYIRFTINLARADDPNVTTFAQTQREDSEYVE